MTGEEFAQMMAKSGFSNWSVVEEETEQAGINEAYMICLRNISAMERRLNLALLSIEESAAVLAAIAASMKR